MFGAIYAKNNYLCSQNVTDMDKKRTGDALQNLNLADVTAMSVNEELIKYNDDELVIVDNLREVPHLEGGRIDFNVVAVCISGRMQLDVSGQSVTVSAQQIFVCHPHVILSNLMISPDFECKVMCLSDRLLRSILQSQMLIWNNMLYKQHFCIIDTPADRLGLYDELRYQWLSDNNPFKREILVSLLRVALLELCHLLTDKEKRAEDELQQEGHSRMETLFHQFLKNVARRRIKKLSVSEYAEELCITPKYLSTVCRTVSGKSPTEWISEYVVEDITHYLKSTELTASQIGIELGFPNASFFGKYVREHLGMSPNEYRKKQPLTK